MKISSIFAMVEESLYSIQFDITDMIHNHTFKYLFKLWNDAQYLENYFEENKKDLNSPFYGYGRISISEAIIITRNEAKEMEKKIFQLAHSGKKGGYKNLSIIFTPLDVNATNVMEFQKSKAYGTSGKKSWLRLYAIRMGDNMFFVSGGGIKLTDRMENDALKLELNKLEVAKMHLEQCYGDFTFVESK